MSIRVDRKLPRIVERDRAVSLTLPLRDAADAVQTLTSATVTITLGSKVIVDAQPATSLGPPASYSLPASTTTSEPLTDECLEVWETNLGVFQVAGFLVRRAYHSQVTQADLTARYPEILKDLDPQTIADGTATQGWRRLAHEKIQRRLLAKGRRPWLIFDPWALVDAEVALALHLWACEASLRYQSSAAYRTLKTDLWAEYQREWDNVAFRYDDDETGQIENGSQQRSAAQPTTVFSATRPRRASGYGYGFGLGYPMGWPT